LESLGIGSDDDQVVDSTENDQVDSDDKDSENKETK
jgi:hypothetical protein